MKEKIKELALQAGGSHYPDVNSKQLEIFTELIIKECLKAVKEADCRDIVLTTFDNGLAASVKERCVRSINKTFETDFR